jgi:hypothetical protein
MTKTVDVASGQSIASTWGNEIRNRTLQIFATSAERDAQFPVATQAEGAHCVTVDTDIVWQKVGSAWVPMMGTVPIFATAAARDAAWPSPTNGAMCVTLDTNSLWQRVSGAWVNKSAWSYNMQTGDLAYNGPPFQQDLSYTMPAIPRAGMVTVTATAYLGFSGNGPQTFAIDLYTNDSAAPSSGGLGTPRWTSASVAGATWVQPEPRILSWFAPNPYTPNFHVRINWQAGNVHASLFLTASLT